MGRRAPADRRVTRSPPAADPFAPPPRLQPLLPSTPAPGTPLPCPPSPAVMPLLPSFQWLSLGRRVNSSLAQHKEALVSCPSCGAVLQLPRCPSTQGAGLPASLPSLPLRRQRRYLVLFASVCLSY